MIHNKNNQAAPRPWIFRFVLKPLLWLISILLVLLISVFVAFRIPKVQQFAAQKAVSFLSGKLETNVQLDRLSIDFPKAIRFEGLYLEDQKKDTLAWLKNLSVDVSFWDLLSNEITISHVRLSGVTGHISREDSTFNFDFIVQAFTRAPKDPVLEKPDGSKPWKFNVGTINLDSVYFTFHDRASGSYLDVHLGHFKGNVKDLDLENSRLRAGRLDLENTRVSYVQKKGTRTEQPDTLSSGSQFNPDVEEIALKNVQFSFNDEEARLHLATSVGNLLLRPDNFDLNKQTIDLKELALSNSSVFFRMGTAVARPDKLKDSTLAASGGNWRVKVKQLTLDNNTFGFDDDQNAPVISGMDYSHLLAKNISINAKEIYYGPEKIALKLNQLSLTEKSGLVIRKFSSEVLYDSSQAELKGLDLQTGKSSLKGDLFVRYGSLEKLKRSPDGLYINTSFNNTSVDLQDVFFFAPDLAKQAILRNASRNRVRINGKLKGTLNELAISELELRLLESTLVRLNGRVRNVTKPDELYLKLSQVKVSGSGKDLQSLLPDTLRPASIEIPESFSLDGTFTGYLKNFNTDLKLNTSIGNLSVRAKMDPEAGNREQPYSVYLTTQSFDVGKLLKQPQTPGPVTMRMEVKGEGRDTSNLHAEMTAAVESVLLKGYNYKNLNISGQIDKQCITAVASVKDRNVDLTFDGRINTDPAAPEYVFKLDLKGADLRALNLSEEDVRVSARIESNIIDHNRKNPEGTASVRDLLVLQGGKKYRLDSLVFRSEFKDSNAEINLESDIISAGFKGDITLSQLPASLTELLNSYFNIHLHEPKKKLNPQRFQFEMRLKDATLLTNNTVPGLEKITPFSLSGEYNSSSKKIKLNGAVPQIIYSGVQIDSLRLSVDSDIEKLDASVGANQISNPTFKFENFSFGTELKNDALAFQFSTNKDDSSKSIGLGGKLSSTVKGYELKFDKDLIFNGERWNVDETNLLVIGKTGVYANKVVLSNGSRAIAINSAEQKENAPLEIRFTDFDLTVVSRMVENNNSLVKGFIDGNIILEKKNGTSAFQSDLVVRDFVFKAVPVGTLKLKADNYGSSSVYSVDLSVDGNGNDLRANGSYNAASKTDNLNLNLTINNLNLVSIEPFTFGQVSRMSGALNGQLAIKGTPAKPELNGHIDFKEAALRPKAIDSYLTIHDGQLNLGSKRLAFNNLAIYDSLNNKATVNGYVGIEDLTALTFDLDVKSTNFLALNTDNKDNPVYYGRIFLDSDIGINGTQSAPRVNVKAKLNKGSYITYVKPESVVTKNESKGIVEFSDSLYQDAIMTRVNDTIDGSSDIKGIDLQATVNFDRSVQLKMFVDPENGDSLYVVGGGTLDFGLDRSGKTSLTGRYRISDGGYHLSISDLVKRNFKIENGSYVTWQGDVLDAYVDIKAVYTIKTSPIDLVQNEISAMSDSERNKYRNLLTFNVYLKMTGFISAPEISFDIQLAPGDRGALNGTINSKLAQLREDETELNKQVFALLTLRRFIGENPLDNGNDGGGLTSASRSSASKVLTQQLSNLSDKYVNFVDLDLGVNSFEDYATGTEQGRTQLQVGVSKQLLNDKVSVHVGGNVELEGERAKQNNASDVAGNISIDYKLTKDGRYKLKAFRENQYENPIEGELTKTGMGFIYTRNYNTFKELFSRPVKKSDPIVVIPSVEKSASDKVKEEDKNK